MYTQIQPLYLSAPLGGTKGKSMGLHWSGAKAVIKRYRRQSHTRHQQWKSFACAALILTPSVTHLSLRASPPHFFSLSLVPSHPFLPLSKLTQECVYLQSCQCICMQTHNIPLMPWMPVIILRQVGAICARGGKLLPLSSQKKVCTQHYQLIGASHHRICKLSE